MAAKKAAAKEAIVAEPIAEAPEAKKPKYADDDNSIDARMWRLLQDHIAMGSRKA